MSVSQQAAAGASKYCFEPKHQSVKHWLAWRVTYTSPPHTNDSRTPNISVAPSPGRRIWLDCNPSTNFCTFSSSNRLSWRYSATPFSTSSSGMFQYGFSWPARTKNWRLKQQECRPVKPACAIGMCLFASPHTHRGTHKDTHKQTDVPCSWLLQLAPFPLPGMSWPAPTCRQSTPQHPFQTTLGVRLFSRFFPAAKIRDPTHLVCGL